VSPAPFALAGEAACLGAAFLWAVSVILFRRPIQQFGARSVNLTKCLIASILQGLTVLWLGQMHTLWAAPGHELLFLTASGLIGLVIGDTALFGCVARIGPHRAMLLQTQVPIFTVLIAAFWPGESPTAPQAGGAALILAGVAIVVSPEGLFSRSARGRRSGSWDMLGVGLGTLAALGQAGGLVLADAGMTTIPAMPASFLRLGAAAVGLAVLGIATGRLTRTRDLFGSARAMARVVPPTLLGTYIALFLMMAGVALASASIAAVLLSTSPIFSLFLEAIQERKRISARGLIGTLLAVAGVVVLTT